MALTENQRVAVLLEILGGPKFASEMRAASAETRRLALQTRLAGREAQLASRRTFLMQQGLFTLRRYAFYGTLAITAMAGAVAKLGYEYLSAMQQARVALSPVIRDQAALNGYLNQLFQISKYSPFVITDLAVAFRQLFAGLHPLGMSPQAVIDLMKSMTDFMSATGKIGPGQMQRLSLAIQHMAYAGRMTGYAVNQMSRLGVPVQAILRTQLGVNQTDASRIARLNIPATAFIAAMERYARITPFFRNAARRQSLKTFHGLLQVARDTISQLSGGIIQGAYGGGQSLLGRLLRQGGPLDVASQIAVSRKRGGGAGAIKYLSEQFTGTTGLGKGILLLTDLVRNLGRVFFTVLVPAFVLALHSLILFYPALKLLNLLLIFMSHHTTTFKIILGLLATEFVLTHSAALGGWLGLKLFKIATFGAIPGIKALILNLKMLRMVELVGLIKRWKDYAFASELATAGSGRIYASTTKNNGVLAKLSRVLFRSVIPAITTATAASWAFFIANAWWIGIIAVVLALTVGLVVLYYKWKRFHDFVNRTWHWFDSQSPVVKLALLAMFGPIIQAAVALKYIVSNIHAIGHFFGIGGGHHATRTVAGGGLQNAIGGGVAYGRHYGASIVAKPSVKPTVNTAALAGGSGEMTLHSVVVMPNGKVLADVVSKARLDKEGTR